MSENLVNNLREITEETDMDTMLKSTLGGYTKKSVMEYLAYVRRQQSDLKLAFNEEKQHMQAERDALQAELEQLRSTEKDSGGPSAEEFALLQRQYAELEKDMAEAVEKIAQDEEELCDSRETIATLQQELDHAREEAEKWKEQCENNEEPLDDTEVSPEILKKTEDVQPLSAQELYMNMIILENNLAIRDRELERLKQRLDTSMRQEQNFYHALEESRKEIQECRDRTECMEMETNDISRRLSAQLEENILLTRENTRLKAQNTTLQRRLEMEQTTIADEVLPENGGIADEMECICAQ